MKALIIIDMQNDFVTGSLGTAEAQAIVPNIVNKMKLHDNTETVIIFTKDTHKEDYLNTPEGQKLAVPHCIESTEGWSIVRDIHDEFKRGTYLMISSDTIVKSRICKSTFGSYDLIDVLAQLELTEIEICGLTTNICLISNAIMIKNAFPDVRVVVDSDCCAGTTPEDHEAALRVMRSCQIDII